MRLWRVSVVVSLATMIGGACGSLPGIRDDGYTDAGNDVVVEANDETDGAEPDVVRADATVDAGPRLYVVGGQDETDALRAEVFSAPILPNGGLGAWRAEGPLPGPRGLAAATTLGGSAIITGGSTGGLSTDILRATPDEAGALATYPTIGALNSERASHAMVAADGRFYVIGGASFTGSTNTIFVGSLDAGGTGTPITTTNLPLARERHGAAIAATYLVVAGGLRSDGGSTELADDVFISAIDGGMVLGFSAGPKLFAQLIDHAMVSVGPWLYTLGGETVAAEKRVTFNVVLSDGGMPNIWQQATAMPAARYDLCAVAFENAIYVVGGAAQDGGAPLGQDVFDTVWSSLANVGDGSLSAWNETLPALPAKRYHHVCFVL
jgi:hypothetical protein